MKKRLALFILLFIGSTFVKLNAQNFQKKDLSKIQAQQSEFPTNFKITSLGNSNGLISSDISALFQDLDGFIWVGTQAGISKYNGDVFKNFTKIDDTFIGRISVIIQDVNGLIWAAGENGLFYYLDGSFHKTSIPINDIQTLHLANEKLYVGGIGFIPFSLSFSDIDHLINGQEITIVPMVEKSIWEGKMRHQQVGAIDTDENGDLWIASYNRLASFDGKDLNVHWKSDSTSFAFNAVRVLDSKTVFWASEDTALILQEGDEFTVVTDPATYIFANNDESSFFLTTMELLAYKNGKFTTLHVLDEYAHLYTKVMIIDREGNFWIGAEGNLIKLTPTYFKKWTHSNESLLHSNHSIAQLKNGKIVVGSTKENILTIKNGEFQIFSTMDVHHGSLTAAIYQDENNWIWYGTSMSGIVLDREGRKYIYSEKDGLGNKGQYFFFKSNSGELWSGGELGISRIRFDQNKRLRFENFMVDEKDNTAPLFQSAFQSPNKTIWTASNKGLYHIEDHKLIQWKFPSSISNSPIITSTKIDKKGQLWISTQGEGLWQCRFNDKNEPELIRQWTVKDGLSSNVVLDILIDKLDRIWVASQTGICSIDFKEADPIIRCFDEIDGWFNEPTSRCRLMEGDNGNLWAVGLTEIVSFPLYHLPINEIQPNTFISQVQLFDGNEDIYKYAVGKKKGPLVPVDLTLPFDKNFLNFHFSTTSYTKPEKNSF